MAIWKPLALFAALVAGAATAATKQLYHVTLPKTVFDAALASFGDDLDVWEVAAVGSGSVRADLYVSEVVLTKFQTLKRLYESVDSSVSSVTIERDPVDTASLIKDSAVAATTCTQQTKGHLDALEAANTSYVQNAFFDCWRTADEVFAFLDSLVTANPSVFSKTASVATTIENRAIPAYKIATNGNSSAKKVVYVQGLIHAREWHAGSTTFYAIAAILDGLRSGDTTIKALVDKYDWVFVPIVNLDGFLYTWASNGDRLWRKNRRQVSRSTYGVDLNRNWGPSAYFGKAGDGASSETYPGSAAYSEPETAGLYKLLKTLPLAGVLDIHSYSGLVLRPFGNQRATAAAPYGAKLKTLGDNVKAAIQATTTTTYTSETAHELYLCYGTILDSVFLEFNNTASLSFEMEGSSFVLDQSVIRPGGAHVFQGVLQFAKELAAYYS